MALVMISLGSLSYLGYGPLSFITILGMPFLDFFDFLTNSVMMPVAAIAICVLVSKHMGVYMIEDEVMSGGKPFKRREIFNFMIRWICPIFSLIILASSVASAFGWITI